MHGAAHPLRTQCSHEATMTRGKASQPWPYRRKRTEDAGSPRLTEPENLLIGNLPGERFYLVERAEWSRWRPAPHVRRTRHLQLDEGAP